MDRRSIVFALASFTSSACSVAINAFPENLDTPDAAERDADPPPQNDAASLADAEPQEDAAPLSVCGDGLVMFLETCDDG